MAAALLRTAKDLIGREENLGEAEAAASQALKLAKDKVNLAEALKCQVLLKLLAHNVDGALTLANEAATFDPAGDKCALAVMKVLQAEVMLRTDAHEEARDLGEAAVQLFNQTGEKEQELSALCGVMRRVHVASKDKQEISRCADRAVELARQLGDKVSQGRAQGLLMSARLLAESREAIQAGYKSLQLFREVEDKEKEATMLHEIAGAHLALKSPVEAAASATEAMSVFLERGDKKRAAACLRTVVQAHAHNGNAKQAVLLVETKLAKAQRGRDQRMMSLLVPVVLEAHLANGSHDVALRKAKSSMQIFQGLGDRAGEANMVLWLARLQLSLGDYEEAGKSAKNAAAMSQDIGDRKGRDDAFFVLDHVCVAKGEPSEAPHRAEALSSLREMARSLEERNGAEFKEAVKRFNNLAGTTQEDIDEIFTPAMEKDKESARVFVHRHAGGDLFQEGGGKEGDVESSSEVDDSIGQHTHEKLYERFRYGGMGFGPRFRSVKMPFGNLKQAEALTVLRASSESQAWELELLFPPYILDGPLQSGSAMGPPQPSSLSPFRDEALN